MYLYRSPKCKEGNPQTCSQGRDSYPPGVVCGGWGCDCDEKNLAPKLEIIERETQKILKEQAKRLVIETISNYLQVNGWISNVESSDLGAAFHWIDPVTGLAHRSDFAYIIQSERDIYEAYKEVE